jgi:hypothetical protein
MVSGGLSKARPEIQISFSGKLEKGQLEYEDKFPEDLPTLEEVKKKYGVVVWCKFTACINNQEIAGLQRTSGTLLKKQGYTPLNDQEATWPGICSRDEIAIKYDEIRGTGGSKIKVPSCFVAATNKTGHMDFSKFLNSDGSPLGGNIDSQHVSDAGYGALDSGNIYEE